MIRNMKPFHLYRNRHMLTADFYPVRMGSEFIEGWWIHRASGEFYGRRTDLIRRDRIKSADWAEITITGSTPRFMAHVNAP